MNTFGPNLCLCQNHPWKTPTFKGMKVLITCFLFCFFRSVMSFVECSMVETHTSTHSQIQLFIKRPWGGAPPILEISVFHISVDCKCSLIFFHFIQWQTAKSAPLTISQINKLTNIFTPFQPNVPSIYGPS